jgi:lipopolysaccharide export system protein LptA
MKRLLLLLPLLAGALALPGAQAPSPAPLQPVAATDTRFRAQKLDMRNVGDETITILTGSVEVTGTNLRITCDRLEIVSTRVGGGAGDLAAKENRFKSLIATGRVRIEQPDSRREATCGRAEILPGDGRVTLTEKPILVDRDEKGVPIQTLAAASMRLFKGDSHVEMDLPEGSSTKLPDLGFEAPTAGQTAAPAPAPIQLNMPAAK